MRVLFAHAIVCYSFICRFIKLSPPSSSSLLSRHVNGLSPKGVVSFSYEVANECECAFNLVSYYRNSFNLHDKDKDQTKHKTQTQLKSH